LGLLGQRWSGEKHIAWARLVGVEITTRM